MFCAKCGNEINDGAAFCPKCGTKTGVYSDETNRPIPDGGRQTNAGHQPSNREKSGSKPLIIVLVIAGILIIVAGIAIGIYLAGKSQSGTRQQDEEPRVKAEETKPQETESQEAKPPAEPAHEESTEELNAEPAQDQEKRLRAIADKCGKIMAWTYADYDGDGRYEAYALTTHKSEWGDEDVEYVIFVDADGNTTFFEPEMKGYTYENDNGNYRECDGKGFFWADVTAGGSGWWTYLYGVKYGQPYKLDLSCKIQGFYEKDGMFYTTEDDIDAAYGHRYANVELIYDSNTQQFIKGKRTGTYSFEEDEESNSANEAVEELVQPKFFPLTSRSYVDNVDYFVEIIDGMYEKTNSGIYDGVGRNNFRVRGYLGDTPKHELIKTFVGNGDDEIDKLMKTVGYKQYEVEYYYDNPDYYSDVISDGPNLIIAHIDGSVYKYYFVGNNLIRRVAPEGTSDNPKTNDFLAGLYKFGFDYRWWFNTL